MTNEKRVWGKKTQTVKLIHAFEMLKKIDQADGQDKIKLLKEYGIKAPLNYILSLNFRKDINLDLPEGMPPLDPKEMDGVTHPDMMGNLATNVHRLKYCMVGSNIKAFKKEEIFSDERMDSTKVIQNQPDQSSPVSLKVTQSRKTEKPDENDFHRSWGIVWN